MPVSGATFLVKVIRCENTSWQGQVQHLEAMRSQHFRSIWELLHLINEGIELVQGEQTTAGLRHWDEAPAAVVDEQEDMPNQITRLRIRVSQQDNGESPIASTDISNGGEA